MKSYDVVILGGGPGGYVAAIRAAQLGKCVALVEKSKLGGTCLHKGCIPTKAYLRSAEVFHTIKKSKEFGVQVSDFSLDFTQVTTRKNQIVDRLQGGIEQLMKKNKIEVFYGEGRINENGHLCVGDDCLSSSQIIIATGSRPRPLPQVDFDGKWVLNSDELLALEELPESLVIVGGGVIGVEWASLLHDFGVKVTVIEAMERLVPTEDEEISKELQRIFKKKGIPFHVNAFVDSGSITKSDEGVTLTASIKEKQVSFVAEKMLVSIGRFPNTDGFGLEALGVELERGFIKVDDFMQTNVPNVYAIGDVNGGLQLAHVASHEGIIAVEHYAGLNPEPLNLEHVPKCIYSAPEMASVGLSEKECVNKGLEVKTAKFPFRAIGKALVYGEVDGFVKLVVEKGTNQLLGIHMIGPHVTELIGEGAIAKVLEGTSAKLGHSVHAHPSLSEAVMEAGLAIDGLALHI